MGNNPFIVGFVARLMIELDEIVGTIIEWGTEHDADEEQVRQQLIARQGSLLIQRSHDLVRHVLNTVSIDPIPEMRKDDFTPVDGIDARHVIKLIPYSALKIDSSLPGS